MVHLAKDYRITSSDTFFFDNNIWMFLYSPIGNYSINKQRDYGNLLDYIRNRERPIFINSLVLSEFSNACLRKEFEIWKELNKKYSASYKDDFLKSDKYKDVIISIQASIKAILSVATTGNDNYNAIDINQVFAEMDKCDFNDAYYLKYCSLQKYIMVTDDADLYANNKSGIAIITYKK